MSIWDRFRRKRTDDEGARRARLLQHGRITEGLILDIGASDTDDADVVYYTYAVGGVDYQSSQMLGDEQQQRPLDYAPGATVSIRYDPRQPGNSVVV